LTKLQPAIQQLTFLAHSVYPAIVRIARVARGNTAFTTYYTEPTFEWTLHPLRRYTIEDTLLTSATTPSRDEARDHAAMATSGGSSRRRDDQSRKCRYFSETGQWGSSGYRKRYGDS